MVLKFPNLTKIHHLFWLLFNICTCFYDYFVCRYIKEVCLRTSSKDILSLCNSLKLSPHSSAPQEKKALTRNILRQDFGPEPVTTQTPPTPNNLYRIKLPKRPNAKKMGFKEHLMEKYRKAKIREAQEKYEMTHKLRAAQARGAREKEEHLFFQSNSFRRRKAFPTVIDSLRDSVLSLLPLRASSKGSLRKVFLKPLKPSVLGEKPSDWKQEQLLKRFKEKYRKEILEKPKTVKSSKPFLDGPPGRC